MKYYSVSQNIELSLSHCVRTMMKQHFISSVSVNATITVTMLLVIFRCRHSTLGLFMWTL